MKLLFFVCLFVYVFAFCHQSQMNSVITRVLKKATHYMEDKNSRYVVGIKQSLLFSWKREYLHTHRLHLSVLLHRTTTN